MEFWDAIKLVFGMTLGIAVIMAIFQMMAQGARNRKINEASMALLERAFQRFPSYRGRNGVFGETQSLLLDEDRRMALVVLEGFAKEISFDQILTAEIQTDGSSLTSSKKTGTMGRALAGGLIGGGAGAVIGAVTAKSVQTTVQVTYSIDLVVATSDPEFPMLTWNFFRPFGMMQSLKPEEIWLYMGNAVTAYNALAPAFTRAATEENGLVAI